MRFFSLIDPFELKGKGMVNQTKANTPEEAVFGFFGEQLELKQTAISVWENQDTALIVVETKE